VAFLYQCIQATFPRFQALLQDNYRFRRSILQGFNGVAAISYLQQHNRCDFFLVLSYCTSHSMPRIYVYCSASPECASIGLLGMVTFSPL
jgi:hypothetical protein